MESFLHYPKYPDCTLLKMTKAELVRQIHGLLRNWEACAQAKENISKTLEKEMNKHKWININDELPKKYEKVLINCSWGEVQEAYLIKGKQWHSCVDTAEYTLDAATHWMPLPEPAEGIIYE